MSDQKYHPSAPSPEERMQPPIVTAQPQPNAGGWLPPSTYPSGLGYLRGLDYLFMSQKIELLQVFTEWEIKYKYEYSVTNIRNEPVYYVTEESGTCWQLCLGKNRSCEFNVYDKEQREVLRIVRPFRCCSYLQVLEVYSGSTLLGSVTEEWSLLRPTFYIRDASDQPVLVLKGSIIRFIETTFEIKSMDEQHLVGIIQKQWSGFAREFFTVSDNFGIHFPKDLDVKIKAVLLGASLLIDLLYFEQPTQQEMNIESTSKQCRNDVETMEITSNQCQIDVDSTSFLNYFSLGSNQIENQNDCCDGYCEGNLDCDIGSSDDIGTLD